MASRRRTSRMWSVADDALVAGMAAGDADAASAFVERFQRRVFGLAYTIVGDARAAEDVAQEALLRAWRHAGVFDPRRGSVTTWLLTITRNLSIDALRVRRPGRDRPGRRDRPARPSHPGAARPRSRSCRHDVGRLREALDRPPRRAAPRRRPRRRRRAHAPARSPSARTSRSARPRPASAPRSDASVSRWRARSRPNERHRLRRVARRRARAGARHPRRRRARRGAPAPRELPPLPALRRTSSPASPTGCPRLAPEIEPPAGFARPGRRRDPPTPAPAPPPLRRGRSPSTAAAATIISVATVQIIDAGRTPTTVAAPALHSAEMVGDNGARVGHVAVSSTNPSSLVVNVDYAVPDGRYALELGQPDASAQRIGAITHRRGAASGSAPRRCPPGRTRASCS